MLLPFSLLTSLSKSKFKSKFKLKFFFNPPSKRTVKPISQNYKSKVKTLRCMCVDFSFLYFYVFLCILGSFKILNLRKIKLIM